MMTNKELQKRAFDMFRDFTEKVKIIENINIEIIDESILVNDLLNAIGKAKRALFKEEKQNKRKTPDFDSSFVIGFVCGNLNVLWYNQYVQKQTNEYKEFIATKALKQFLLVNEIQKIQITEIYKLILNSDSNLNNLDNDIELQSIDNKLIEDIQENMQQEIEDNAIIKMLDNRINKYIKDYVENSCPDYIINPSKYFTLEEATFLINNNF